MQHRKQSSYFEKCRIFMMDVFDEEIQKSNHKNKKINFSILATIIRKSVKQTKRLFKSYVNDPSNFHKHKNKNKIPVNKISLEKQTQLVNLYLDFFDKASKKRHATLVIIHSIFYKLFEIKKIFNISYSTMSKILNDHNLISARANRKTKLKNTLMLKNNLKPKIINEKELKRNYEIVRQFCAYKSIKPLKLLKPKTGCFGRIVEYDGCFNKWCNNEKYCMLAAVDSFTGVLLNIRFEKQETTNGYYHLSNDLFKKYGLPKQIRTDKRTTFWNDDNSNSPLPKCFRSLGIGIASSTEPTFKPNVERMFQSMQYLLPIYCYKANINDLETLKKHSEKIVDFYNLHYSKNTPETSEFEKKDSDFIEKSLVYQREAKVLHGNNVSFQGKRYAPFDKNGKRILMLKNGYVTIRQGFEDNKPYILRGSTKYYLKKISYQDDYSFKVNQALKIERNFADDLKHQKIINKLKKENQSLKETIRKNNLKIICQL